MRSKRKPLEDRLDLRRFEQKCVYASTYFVDEGHQIIPIEIIGGVRDVVIDDPSGDNTHWLKYSLTLNYGPLAPKKQAWPQDRVTTSNREPIDLNVAEQVVNGIKEKVGLTYEFGKLWKDEELGQASFYFTLNPNAYEELKKQNKKAFKFS